MKKLFKKIARMLVIFLANRNYDKAVRLANNLYQKDNKQRFVAFSPENNNKLLVFNRKEFRQIKTRLKMYRFRSGVDVASMKAGAFYYTPDGSGQNGLNLKGMEARRRAYVRHLLASAKLN